MLQCIGLGVLGYILNGPNLCKLCVGRKVRYKVMMMNFMVMGAAVLS